MYSIFTGALMLQILQSLSIQPSIFCTTYAHKVHARSVQNFSKADFEISLRSYSHLDTLTLIANRQRGEERGGGSHRGIQLAVLEKNKSHFPLIPEGHQPSGLQCAVTYLYGSVLR